MIIDDIVVALSRVRPADVLTEVVKAPVESPNGLRLEGSCGMAGLEPVAGSVMGGELSEPAVRGVINYP